MRILISGAGIAGPTLAYWLLRYGFRPTLLESAPGLRTGGYLIDFWGTGYDIAERMGLLPQLQRAGYMIEKLKLVGASGERVGGFSARVFQAATYGRYVSLARGDLATSIYRIIEGRIETLFGERITSLTEGRGTIHVTFERAPARDFDLVIGADGLHSGVRRLAFGDAARFEQYLGYGVAAFEIEGYRPREELTYVSYSRPGRQAARFALRDDRTLILMVFAEDDATQASDDAARPVDLAAKRRLLHARFDDAGWECPQILAAMDRCESLYVDRVSQIHMDRWSSGRVALVGDAAACPSLLAGQGSSLAMTAAYVLAGELNRSRGDHAAAFAAYEALLRPLIEAKQRSAAQFAETFTPRTELGLRLRNLVTRAMRIPFVAELALGRSLRDDLCIPDYAADAG